MLPRVVARHQAGKFKIVGNGKNKVDLTHVDNVVHAHLCAFESMKVNASLGEKPISLGRMNLSFLGMVE